MDTTTPDLDLDKMRAQRARTLAATYRKRRALAQLRGIPTAPIDAAPIRTHTKQLLALHWGTPAIIAATGADVTPTGLLLLANGTSQRAERKFARILTLPLTLHVPDTAEDQMWVPSLGAVRRVRALMALGWRHEDITELIGRSSHHLSAQRHNVINALDWRLVAAAFETMSTVPGPSPKAKARAMEKGYGPPHSWDDIDDPKAKPVGILTRHPDKGIDPVVIERVLAGDGTVPASRVERTVVCRRWVEDLGRPLVALESITGWATHRYYRIKDEVV